MILKDKPFNLENFKTIWHILITKIKDYFLGDDKIILCREIKEGKEFDEDNDYKFQESDLLIEDIDIDKLQNYGQLIGQFIAKFYSEPVFQKICLD